VRIFTHNREFFEAVSVEKSGFKGMRLLVRDEIVTPRLRRVMALPVGSHWLIPIRRLRHGIYGQGPSENLQDFLWMSTSEGSEWKRLEYIMSSRLRDCAAEQEEFAQAAAAQVLFHEATAIYHSVANRAARDESRAG